MSKHPSHYTDEFSFILRPSPISGIGVFSVHEIDKNVRINTSPESGISRRMKGEEIPEEFKIYCIAEADGFYRCPKHFNRMEIGWFINHSAQPNAYYKPGAGIFTSKAIAVGEEITIDYNDLDEPESTKEDYYKR